MHLNVSIEIYEFLCRYQALDPKGRNIVQFVLDNEYLRCSDGINFEEYTEEDIEKDLKKFEEEMGIDLLG